MRRSSSWNAAVIVMDVRMPDMGGFETAARIRSRKRTRDIPILFLTAYDSEGDTSATRGYALGAVDYVVKPIDPEALKAKVAVFVELYRKTALFEQEIADRKRTQDQLRESGGGWNARYAAATWACGTGTSKEVRSYSIQDGRKCAAGPSTRSGHTWTAGVQPSIPMIGRIHCNR